MAVNKEFTDVQYVGTFIIPHPKYHAIAVVSESESGNGDIFVIETSVGKGIMDAIQYWADAIPPDWKRIDGEVSTE